MGGNVIFYSSDKGQAMMRGTGEMILIFNENLPDLGSDQLRSATRYVERKGIALYDELAEYAPAGEGATVSSPCAVNGYCVYNSRLVFNISGGRLMMIDGIRAFDGEIELQEEETIDAVSAIMYFLDAVRNEGIICREICGIEAGYFMNVAVLGECTLRPVWKVITDTGDIYINALSGKHELLTMG